MEMKHGERTAFFGPIVKGPAVLQVVHFLICEITGPPRLEGYLTKLMSEGIIHMCMESLNQHVQFVL